MIFKKKNVKILDEYVIKIKNVRLIREVQIQLFFRL